MTSTQSTTSHPRRLAPTDSDHDYWEKKSLKYDCQHDRIHQIVQEVQALSPRRVLDLGCSTGQMALALESVLPGIEYYGCDISQSAVDRLARPTVVTWNLNDQGPPFAGQKFDVVLASGIFEYIANLPDFLSQLSQRLSSGGYLVCSYINTEHVGRLARRLIGKQPARNPTWQEIHPLSRFEEILALQGFSIQNRLPTSGRIEKASGLGPGRHLWRKILSRSPKFIRFFAPQVIFVCRI